MYIQRVVKIDDDVACGLFTLSATFSVDVTHDAYGMSDSPSFFEIEDTDFSLEPVGDAEWFSDPSEYASFDDLPHYVTADIIQDIIEEYR